MSDQWRQRFPKHWQCRYCTRLRRPEGKVTCDAFPEGIPQTIQGAYIGHTKAIGGERNGLIFEPTSDYDKDKIAIRYE